MENTMTNEVMEMVEDVDVIEVAEQYVPEIGVMDIVKGAGKFAGIGLAIYGGFRLVKDVIIPGVQRKKNPETEMVDCDACDDYTEAIDEADVDVEDEE
jgi:hypothetical protein